MIALEDGEPGALGVGIGLTGHAQADLSGFDRQIHPGSSRPRTPRSLLKNHELRAAVPEV